MIFNWNYMSPRWNDNECRKIEDIERIAEDIFPIRTYDAVRDIKIIKDVDEIKYSRHIVPGLSYHDIVEKFDKTIDVLGELEENFASSCIQRIIDLIIRIKEKHELYDEGESSCERVLYEEDKKDIISELERIIDESDVIDKEGTSSAAVTLINDLIEALRKTSYRFLVLGEFHPAEERKDSYIIIYMRAIDEVCEDICQKDILVEQVIAHELFHALHYLNADYNVYKAWTKEHKMDFYNIRKRAVKESLADCFAAVYLSKIIDVCRGGYYKNESEAVEYEKALEVLENKWRMHDFPGYPYSGAQYIFEENPETEMFEMEDYYYPVEYSERRYRGRFFACLVNLACRSWKASGELIYMAAEEGLEAAFMQYLRMIDLKRHIKFIL